MCNSKTVSVHVTHASLVLKARYPQVALPLLGLDLYERAGNGMVAPYFCS